MANKVQAGRPKRVSEIQEEISSAGAHTESDERVATVLAALEKLRRAGIQRSRYNLASPYGLGFGRSGESAAEGSPKKPDPLTSRFPRRFA
jgi:hypothetical protein